MSSAVAAWWRDPWRKPRVLATVTIVYLLWSLLPGADRRAVLVQRRPVAHGLAGLLDALVLRRPAALGLARRNLHTALIHTLRLGVITTLITVPLGVAFALGLDRWRGRLPVGRQLH